MPSTAHSNAITPPTAFWPFAETLPKLSLYRCSFSAESSLESVFLTHGVPIPNSLHNAANQRKNEFLAGRLCAAHALFALRGGSLQYPGISAERAPIWPQGSLGSITHSHELAAAIVGLDENWHAIGLDVEPLIPASKTRALARKILVADELSHIAQCADEEAARYLTQCFSAKESLFKTLYPLVKQRFYFSAAALIEFQKTGQFYIELRETLSQNWRKGCVLKGLFVESNGLTFTLLAVPKC